MRLFYSIYLTQKINKNHKISRSIDFSKHHTKPPWSLKWLEGNYFRARGKKYAIKSYFVNHESVSKVFEDYKNSDLYFNTGIFGIACVISSKSRVYWRFHKHIKLQTSSFLCASHNLLCLPYFMCYKSFSKVNAQFHKCYM